MNGMLYVIKDLICYNTPFQSVHGAAYHHTHCGVYIYLAYDNLYPEMVNGMMLRSSTHAFEKVYS